MDRKLEGFYAEARRAGLLDDTLLIVTSDHGEGFGEHGLYLHDSSVYQTHLHVPLYVHHPDLAPGVVDDVVSTRDLFGLMAAVGRRGDTGRTILGPGYRGEHPIALAEHFHYPGVADMLPGYRQDIAAAIAWDRKIIVRREGLEAYDLARDPGETAPERTSVEDFAAACRREGLPEAAVAAAAEHVGRWTRKAAA
jgi:hypothetical protein